MIFYFRTITLTQKRYDRIIANPPFTKNQDIDHLRKMYDDLSEGGRIVCVTSKSWLTGRQNKQELFKGWLGQLNAEIEDLPEGTFKKSGTMVGAKLITIDK